MSVVPARPAAATPTRREELRVELRCIECNGRFDLSARYARQVRCGRFPAICRECRRPSNRGPVTDADRRFWLERFSDDEIAVIATALYGGAGDAATVATWRARLCRD